MSPYERNIYDAQQSLMRNQSLACGLQAQQNAFACGAGGGLSGLAGLGNFIGARGSPAPLTVIEIMEIEVRDYLSDWDKWRKKHAQHYIKTK